MNSAPASTPGVANTETSASAPESKLLQILSNLRDLSLQQIAKKSTQEPARFFAVGNACNGQFVYLLRLVDQKMLEITNLNETGSSIQATNAHTLKYKSIVLSEEGTRHAKLGSVDSSEIYQAAKKSYYGVEAIPERNNPSYHIREHDNPEVISAIISTVPIHHCIRIEFNSNLDSLSKMLIIVYAVKASEFMTNSFFLKTYPETDERNIQNIIARLPTIILPATEQFSVAATQHKEEVSANIIDDSTHYSQLHQIVDLRQLDGMTAFTLNQIAYSQDENRVHTYHSVIRDARDNAPLLFMSMKLANGMMWVTDLANKTSVFNANNTNHFNSPSRVYTVAPSINSENTIGYVAQYSIHNENMQKLMDTGYVRTQRVTTHHYLNKSGVTVGKITPLTRYRRVLIQVNADFTGIEKALTFCYARRIYRALIKESVGSLLRCDGSSESLQQVVSKVENIPRLSLER